LAGFLPAFTWGLGLALGGKRLLLVACLAVLVTVAITHAEVGARHWERAPDSWLDLWLLLDQSMLTYVLPLVVLLTVARGLRVEIGRQTLVYHLARPVGRTTLFLARFAAGVVPATLVGTLALVACAVASRLPLDARVWASFPLTALVTAVTLGAVYYAVTSLWRGGLIVALIYTFVFEPLFSGQSGSMQKLSIMFHVRGVYHALADGFFVARSKGVAQALAVKVPDLRSIEWTNADSLLALREKLAYDPLGTALLVCAAIAAAALAWGAWRIARRDFPLKG
jgi:ABC-type transport system involved in multi-copper enzyme maturation permease subunit